MSRITDILPCPNKKGRFDIYADGELILTLSDDAVVECSLRVGSEVSEQELIEIEAKVTLVRAKAKAYDLLSYGDMSRKTLCTKLARYGYDEDTITSCADSLEQNGYIDDMRYAERLAAYLANSRLYGRRRIFTELMQNGVGREHAQCAIDALDTDFYQSLCTLVSKERITDEKSVIRLKNRLVRYGYDYDMIASVLSAGEDYD